MTWYLLRVQLTIVFPFKFSWGDDVSIAPQQRGNRTMVSVHHLNQPVSGKLRPSWCWARHPDGLTPLAPLHHPIHLPAHIPDKVQHVNISTFKSKFWSSLITGWELVRGKCSFQLRLQKIHSCNRISSLLNDLLICHPCNWVYLLIPLPNKTSTKSGCSRSWIAHIIYKYSLCSWLIVLNRNHRFSFHIWVPQEAGPLNIPAVLSQVQGTSHVCLDCVYRLVVS